MKNNKGFTLIELLAVIVVLAIVIALAVTSILPSMTSAREQAFRVEASRIVKRAKDALEMYKLGELEVNQDNKSCVTATKACFTVKELIDKGVSEIKQDIYSGRVEMTLDNDNPTGYTLYFKKSDEYTFVNESYGDFHKNGTLNDETWEEGYESCSCS